MPTERQAMPQPMAPLPAPRPSLAALAAKATRDAMATSAPPPFAPFMIDPAEAGQWKGGAQRMSEREIGEVVNSHFRMLFSWAPYTEDLYRLNYLAKNQLATRQQTHYLYQHKPLCDCGQQVAPKLTNGQAVVLGRIGAASTKKPRQVLQVVEEEDGKLYEVEAVGEMRLDAHRSMLLAIERAHLWVMDIEDLDRLALSFSPASRSTSQPVLTQFLARRTATSLSLANFFVESRALRPQFPAELIGVTKGAQLFARSLRVLPPEHRSAIVPVFVGALGSIAASRAAAMAMARRTGEDESAAALASIAAGDAALRMAQIEAARLTSEVLRRAGPPSIAASIRELSRFPPGSWPDLLRLPEALLVIGTVLHRGVELNLHVGATAGSDVISRLAASIGIALSGPPSQGSDQAFQQQQQQQGPTERNATLLWCESFPFVWRGIVDALNALTQWRLAAASTVPPAPAPEAYPGAVWEILVALALVASLEQREVMRQVIGAVVAVGGLDQASGNPAVLALHQLLLRS